MLCIHSYHGSCQCYFLHGFIRLSNRLMVFQRHSPAVQSADSVTGSIWCNLCADKWEAEFPGCEAHGRNSVWARPGRAPFFGCQVARGQACGGAAQSAPSNWNVERGAGTAPCLFLSHKGTHSNPCVHEHSHQMNHFLLCPLLKSNSTTFTRLPCLKVLGTSLQHNTYILHITPLMCKGWWSYSYLILHNQWYDLL